MWSLHCNLTYLVGIAIEFDLLCLLETFVSSRLNSAKLLVPGFNKTYLKFSGVNLVREALSTRGIAAYVHSGYQASKIKNLECSFHEMLVARVPGRLSNYYTFGIYRSPSVDENILDRLLAKLVDVQQRDSKDS